MSMASDRQKYNFLAAWVKQLDQARDEDDDLAAHVRKLIAESIHEIVKELHERIDGIEQWSARADLALEELDSDWGEGSGEEPEQDADGDYDDELEVVEPTVGRVRQPDGRPPAAVGGARERPLARRSVAKTLRNVRSK